MNEIANFDPNYTRGLQAESNVDNDTTLNLRADPTDDNRLLVQSTITDGTNTAVVNSSGQLHVVLMGMVDDTNSSAVALLADATFTGTATDILDFGFVFITVFSDVASATDGLSVEQSSDGTNWDNTDTFTIPANTGKTYSFQPAAKFFRVVYTNGGTNQGAFRLQTVYKKTSSLPSSHRISNNLSPEDDASLQIAIIKGQNPGGDYVDFSATAGGNFKVSVEEFDDGAFPSGTNGGPVTVGTTEVEMTFTGTTRSIMLQSDSDNTGKIWIGLTGVTNSGGNAFVQLDPGSSMSMDLNDASNALFAISDTASQNVNRVALT